MVSGPSTTEPVPGCRSGKRQLHGASPARYAQFQVRCRESKGRTPIGGSESEQLQRCRACSNHPLEEAKLGVVIVFEGR